MLAQGQRLGKDFLLFLPAPTGRHEASRYLLPSQIFLVMLAFRATPLGFFFFSFLVHRALPWANIERPFGAKHTATNVLGLIRHSTA